VYLFSYLQLHRPLPLSSPNIASGSTARSQADPTGTSPCTFPPSLPSSLSPFLLPYLKPHNNRIRDHASHIHVVPFLLRLKAEDKDGEGRPCHIKEGETEGESLAAACLAHEDQLTSEPHGEQEGCDPAPDNLDENSATCAGSDGIEEGEQGDDAANSEEEQGEAQEEGWRKGVGNDVGGAGGEEGEDEGEGALVA